MWTAWGWLPPTCISGLQLSHFLWEPLSGSRGPEDSCTLPAHIPVFYHSNDSCLLSGSPSGCKSVRTAVSRSLGGTNNRYSVVKVKKNDKDQGSQWSLGFDGKLWGREAKWSGDIEPDPQCVQEDWTGRYREESSTLGRECCLTSLAEP